MPVGKNSAKINFVGGGALYLNTDLDETEMPDGSPTSPWDELGYLDEEGTKMTDTEEEVEVRDETGAVVVTKNQNRSVGIETTLLQTGKDEIDYLNSLRGTDVQAYYEVPVEDGAKMQKWHFPKVRITPQFELQFGNALRKLPASIKVAKKSAVLDYYTVTETAIV